MIQKIKNFIERLRAGFNIDILPGHFYSPIISSEETKKDESLIYNDKVLNNYNEIDLNDLGQKQLINKFKEYYKYVPYLNKQIPDGYSYYFENGYFSYTDGIMLYIFLNYYKPQKIVEVGSGFSSCIMQDVNLNCLNEKMELTFIEPYPERLLRNSRSSNFNLIQQKVQYVDLKLFDNLEKGDILFIDSSHISKVGSDVNYLLFQVIPRLKSGVFIHFHDIFKGFEYPKEWVFKWKGFGWNEAYILRAYLMNNKNYKIVLFNNYIVENNINWFKNNMPLCLLNSGASLWLEKK